MTSRVLRFIASTDAAAPPVAGVEQIVLDTAWSVDPAGRSDLRSARSLIRAALADHQPLAEALGLIDAWADAAGLVERLEVEGISHWYRRRLVYWRWLHDRLIWHWLVAGLAAEGPIDRLEIGPGEPELRQMAGLAAARSGWGFQAEPDVSAPAAAPSVRRDPVARIRDRLRAPGRRSALEARVAAMDERLSRLGLSDARILVPTDPTVFQTVTAAGATGRVDPFLGPVVEALAARGIRPVLFEVGARSADDATWAALEAPGGARTLPGSILAQSLADPADDSIAAAVAADVAARIAGPLPALDLDGIDLGPPIAAELRAWAGAGLQSELRQERRIGRLLRRLRPAAVLMINEYSRPEWLNAARREGIPVGAVQHGIIHALHAGYMLPARAPSLVLADRTYVFGRFEAKLLTESSAYRPAEVRVTGAPRLDLRAASPLDPAERAAIRADLAVAPGARLLVFSSTSSAAVRRTVIAAAFDAILDRAWPNTHLVIKLHPGEDDGSFYPGLIEGLARARGFAPPPTTLIKAIDLLRLLTAADAHLGVYSTVLTDAVTVGTSNLIVTSLRGSDLLGYVQAGVAQPVTNGAELLAALDAPPLPEVGGAARAAFLAEHFVGGPAAPRIVADLLDGFAARLELRRATAADADLLLEWTNDPQTRAASFHSAQITPDEHRRWLADRLASPATTLWIGLRDGVPIGQVRIELDDQGIADIGISLAPAARGGGTGRRLLARAISEANRTLPVAGFMARIRPENARSLALFSAVGFGQAVPGESEGEASVVLRLAASPGAARSPGRSRPRAPGSPLAGR